MRIAALTIAGALLLGGCASLEPFEAFEPRADDPLLEQVGKTLAYVPVVVVGSVVVLGGAIAADKSAQLQERAAIESELGWHRSQIDRAYDRYE